MDKENQFITGKILAPLLKFALPILLALFLQSMYGAVDLLIVGQFGQPADVSAVSTGSQIMMTLTNLMVGLAMGTTIFLGQKIGEGKKEYGGAIVGANICLFLFAGILLTLLIPLGAGVLAHVMHAPEEAFELTVSYIRICGAGSAVIIAYNLIGSIFRGMGDSKTPLITVVIACFCNILGDLLLVGLFHMGTAGAALATVFAQAVSVVISLLLGFPIALQDLLVGISFLILLAIVNSLGLTASAGVGVAEKVCGFIMLVPSAFMQAMSAFVAQNWGAEKYDRAKKSLVQVISVSLIFAVAMFYLSFFHGDLLSGIFSKDARIISASFDYLRAYAIDCLLTCFLFCFIGFFTGTGETNFVMVQGLVGAFCVRIPVSFFMSRQTPVSLFHVGLATLCSTIVQIILCLAWMQVLNRKLKAKKTVQIRQQME